MTGYNCVGVNTSSPGRRKAADVIDVFFGVHPQEVPDRCRRRGKVDQFVPEAGLLQFLDNGLQTPRIFRVFPGIVFEKNRVIDHSHLHRMPPI
jgi:hypothetical protein